MADPQPPLTGTRPFIRDRLARWGVPLACLLLVVLLVSLAGHVYLGSFSRRIADDFCTAASLRRLGFWGSQLDWYRDWSGRFSFTFVVNVTHLAGDWLTPWLPGLAVGLWTAALVGLMRRLRSAWSRGWAWLGPTVLAALALFLTLRGAPNPYQSLYWQTGMLTYSLPLILATANLAWLVPKLALGESRRPVGTASLLAAGALPFVAGGFSETYVTLQTGALILGLLTAVVLFRGARRAAAVRLLAAGLLGSGLALALIVLAPGNEIRRSLMPASPDLWTLTQHTILDAYIYVYQVAKYQTIHLLLAVTLPALLAVVSTAGFSSEDMDKSGSWLPPLLGIPVLTALLVAIPFAPSEYALSSYPDGRVLITQQYVLFLGIVLWAALVGVRIGQVLRERRGSAMPIIALALLAAGLATTAWLATESMTRLTEDAPIYREFASTWDDRDERLREAARVPADTVAVPSLRHMGGLAEIGDDPAEWINVCIAGAYDVGAVVAK